MGRNQWRVSLQPAFILMRSCLGTGSVSSLLKYQDEDTNLECERSFETFVLLRFWEVSAAA